MSSDELVVRGRPPVVVGDAERARAAAVELRKLRLEAAARRAPRGLERWFPVELVELVDGPCFHLLP